ncbi:hypothetical protein ASF10_11295 [Flavobacterium sp. Leaf82]|uniref:hypothetical protein n=1 Tax=unclassified Flavobacterium TaxID=196869 RepID=UPI0007010546|nr:hypothetical protein [Flavobacterium sp. Leaf82]KQO22928.1 hypothetical protein ASF10_11295 [Flavobacterium sp. Leaf82]
MKLIKLLVLIFISNSINAQELKSSSLLIKELEVVSKDREMNILISESEIVLKKYLDNNRKDLIRKIEKIEEKSYNGINCIWYYCISTEKDIFRNDYRKSIFIYDKLNRNLLFADFASEVDVFWTKFFF